ncbi:rhomboid-like protein 1 [Tanacetum coccineum]
MLGFAFIGFRLEKEFGYLRIGVLYVLSGIGGSILSSLFIRTTISVGASGALFGLLGAMLSELLTNWTIYANKFAALLTLILIILINIVFGFIPHVDNYAHIGGFFTGFFLGFVVLIRPQFKWINQKHVPPGYVAPTTRSKYKRYQCILLILSLIALLVGFIVSLILLYRGVDGNDYCSWCHYLTCIPTPLWTCSSRCSLSQLDKQVNMTCLPNGLNSQRLNKEEQEVKNIAEPTAKHQTRTTSCLQNFKVISKESIISLNNTPQISPVNAITHDLPTTEPEDSLIMGNEELSTIHEKESDEFNKSSVEDLIPIPREFEDTSGSDSVCVLPSSDDFSPIVEEKSVTFSNPLFEFDDEYISNDVSLLFDEVLEDIECKDSYGSNLDEPTLLVTPLSDANKDECFDPGGDNDEIDAFLDMDICTDI